MIAPGDLDGAWEQLVEMKKFKVVDGVLGGEDEFSEKLVKQLRTDQSLVNGTSIAFLAEFDGRSCLFLADAHADVVCASIRKIIPEGKKRLKVDALKMSHHGSRANISEELMSLIDAKHYLVSTDGSHHNHPDKPAIEAVIQWSVRKPTLWFNYRSPQNLIWEAASARAEKKFTAKYPEDGGEGIVVEL